MASPAMDAVLGGSGAAKTPTATPVSGGSAALNAVLGTAPAGVSAAPKHGGGGFLGTLERIPGDFVSHAVPDIENSIIGTGRWLYSGIAPGTHPSFGTLAHEWTNIFRHPVQEFQREKDPFAAGSVALAKGVATTVQHPARDPFATFLLLAPLVKGGINFGAATRAGLKGEDAAAAAAKTPGVITARAVEGGAGTVVRVLPRNDPYKAGRMRAVDKALKTLVPPTYPVIGEFKRAARSVDRAAKVPMLKALADPRLAAYQRALGKLDEKDRVALGVLARVPLPKDLDAWKGVLTGQNTEVASRLVDVLSDPKVLERYTEFERFPKIVTAHLAAKALVGANEEIAGRTGALTPETAAAAAYIPTRVARGAEWVNRTPARLGRVSTIHNVAIERVARLEKLHAKAVLTARRNAAAAILGLKGRLTVAQKDAALAWIENRPSITHEGPPPAEGMVRLYRGERADSDSVRGYKAQGMEPGDETFWFTRNPDEAAGFADGGKTYYVDVPAASLRDYAAPGGSYHLPGTIASKSRRFRPRAVPGLIGNKIFTAEGRAPITTTTTRSVPRTPEEAAARLSQLEQLHNAQADEIHEAQLGPISPQAEAGRTRTNRAIRKAQTGLTKRGKQRGTISPLARQSIKPSLREERRRMVENQIDEAVRADPTLPERVPQVAAWLARREEIGRLQHALGSHDLPEWAREPGVAATPADLGMKTKTETVTREGAPGAGRLLTPLGGVRAEALGYALSHAREDLARIEARAKGQIRETGLVGGHSHLTAEQVLLTYRDLEQKVSSAERRVEQAHGPADNYNLGTPTSRNWQDWSRRRGYTEAEIADFQHWLDLNKALHIKAPDGQPGVDSPFGMTDEGLLEHARAAPHAGIAAEVVSSGRPQPFKMPDRALSEEQILAGSGTGSGLTVPLSPIRESHGTLMRVGAIDLVHDRLTPHYLANARYEAKILKHELAKELAAPVEEGAGRPVGTVWLRTSRGEKIPHLEDVKVEHLAELDRLFPKEGEHPFTLTDEEARANPELIETNEKGQRLVVSKEFADGLTHAYRAESTALHRFVSRPLDVWRALVLNLRVPWLLNNIVGNNLLYALKFAGYGGLRAYLNMIRDMHGPRAVGLLLNDHSTRLTLSREDIDSLVPAQARGTFIGTQLPTGEVARTRVGRKTVKAARFLNAGLAPLDRRTEAFLRRGGVNAVLRESPEAQKIYKAMPKQTASWRDAMMQAGQENPHLLQHVDREVNDALGDYLSLGPVERGALRRAVPFYGWYREITRIAAHTILDRPLRAAILVQLGQMEAERQQDERGAFPSFLQGSFALGPGPMGTENILALRSANPLSTTVDLGRAAAFFANPTNRANAEALLGIANPFAQTGGQSLFGSARGDVADQGYQGGAADWLSKHLGFPGQVVGGVFGGLPQAQVLFPPPPSRLYPTRTRWDIFERLFGDVRRNPNLQQAHYYASQGR